VTELIGLPAVVNPVGYSNPLDVWHWNWAGSSTARLSPLMVQLVVAPEPQLAV
jgi:hypothetical protein